MTIYTPIKYFFIFLAGNLSFSGLTAHCNKHLHLSKHDAEVIGKKIWKNESGGKVEGLTFWKNGEDWASVGIGHFIWYPKNKVAGFSESFPLLIKFIKNKHHRIPAWLINKQGKTISCPWSSREEFFKNFDSKYMIELRRFLVDTISLQAEFIAKRLLWSFPKIVEKVECNKKEHILHQFKRLAGSPNGLYALIDYLNFKGEGISPTEKYNGIQWGLLQVLEKMEGKQSGYPAVVEFADSAKEVLTNRVKHSPKERNEAQWLTGWKNRIDTYTSFPKLNDL